MSTTDAVWSEQNTSPSVIEAALRRLVAECHAATEQCVPARTLNLVCVVDREWSGEIANRLRRVGRYHASRTVVCAVEPRRTTIDAQATISVEGDTRAGEFAAMRELVIVHVGERHLHDLDTIVDPLVVTDLATVVWSPHGHPEAVDALLPVAQVVLIDSVNEPDPAAAVCRAGRLAERAYVVDLAWLRSTPWRERVASTFDPPQWRVELPKISAVTVRHSPGSAIAGLLLLGWMAVRLGWRPGALVSQGGALHGTCHGRRQDVRMRLEPDDMMRTPGLAGLTIETASGMSISLDRGPGGLSARGVDRKGRESEWTVMGASRGEAGILGEGIRHALLRDKTYGPALSAAGALLG